MVSAVSTLGKIMVDANAPPATRLRAADCILSDAAKAVKIEDIDARVSELERRKFHRERANRD